MNIKYDYPYVFKNNEQPHKPVIFVHGFNSKPATFSIFENYWTKTDYYAIQFPGCNGVKAIKNHELSVNQYAELLIKFMIDNNLKDVTLIGHSMGGGIISLAYKLRPDLIGKMVFVAPMNKTSLKTVDTYNTTYFPKNFEEFLNFLSVLYYDISKFTNDKKWMKLAKENFDPNEHNNADVIKLGNSLPLLELHDEIEDGLKSIKVPSLLILGEKDGVIDRENCLKYFNKNVENIKTVFIPKTGHMMFEENWEEFISILEPFIIS
ncbi:alpha/beta hydrolase [Mycoplasma sp. ES3157-GEN-MYC]|uniref:Alpha/beta hydrolase n=1 Tax=Mycoplasma miroungigenitalium TaxID=754515 RepID=A0A6M4JB59_9MOLU|nr:alpha/beta hydrolase [Mycoplasma miroungigenitalium]MBU4690394.1 alpha/beta hydrolase [Mycoplasma miroungigenitalium]MBU4691661.1 alpha/beta hydrolase [Mycoplasma miroungigenitalium]QJR43488.1 alpha/beta hydrolase [Mycoplasma miroungigenitalium]